MTEYSVDSAFARPSLTHHTTSHLLLDIGQSISGANLIRSLTLSLLLAAAQWKFSRTRFFTVDVGINIMTKITSYHAPAWGPGYNQPAVLAVTIST
ncbi:hypothetical protein F4775DRAFT_573861 [Biscogniauxia sp. FL1348]|nr:hypothetical protein F4775DRAFT_573861 [Biscogniauxia sp. FL1348]